MPKQKAVSSSILELLKSLQDKDYLDGFYLVGGTALALHYNHRVSVDIDLFSNFSFQSEQLLERIQHDYDYQLFSTSENTLKGHIKGVNVDLIAHRYPYLYKPEKIQGIYSLSMPDIIAMKLNAISISGQRVKDFIDIYYALEHYAVSEMINFYQTKYNQNSSAHVIKSLIYFEDVNVSDWPVIIKDPGLKWADVQRFIERKVIQFVKSEIN